MLDKIKEKILSEIKYTYDKHNEKLEDFHKFIEYQLEGGNEYAKKMMVLYHNNNEILNGVKKVYNKFETIVSNELNNTRNDANYSTRVAEIATEAEAKASTEDGFMQYLIESNCEDWYAGDPNGDIGDGTTFVDYLKNEGYDADSVSSNSDEFLKLLAKCEYEKYADSYDAVSWWTNQLSANYINEGLADGIDVETITGITKVDDLTCTVLVNGINISGDRQLALQALTPKHYYGEGFTKGDLSMVKAKNDTPMGSGPYKWVGYDNNVVSVTRFDDYFLGTPKIENIK